MFWPWKKQQFNFEKFLKKAAKFEPFEIKKYDELFCHLKDNAQQVGFEKLGLKLLVISDTHGYFAFGENRLPNYLDTIGEFDLCVLLGDVHPAEMPLILDCIPREKIIALKGNHDSFSVYSDFGVRDIAGTDFEYKGVRFVGIDGSFKYKKEQFPSHTQYESLREARCLPVADVLLTHDVMLSDFERELAHAGLIGITYYIYKKSRSIIYMDIFIGLIGSSMKTEQKKKAYICANISRFSVIMYTKSLRREQCL